MLKVIFPAVIIGLYIQLMKNLVKFNILIKLNLLLKTNGMLDCPNYRLDIICKYDMFISLSVVWCSLMLLKFFTHL